MGVRLAAKSPAETGDYGNEGGTVVSLSRSRLGRAEGRGREVDGDRAIETGRDIKL